MRLFESRLNEVNGTRFISPYGVAVDGSDNLWVSDTGSGLISKFNPSGSFLAQGSGPGASGSSIAFSDASNHLYVGDSSTGELWVLNADATFNSKITGAWGAGCCSIQVAADNSGTATDGALFVSVASSEATPSTIHRLNGTGSPSNFSGSASYISANQLTGTPAHNFANLQGVAVDQATGDIYALDAGNNEVDQFKSSGVFVKAFTGSFGSISAVAVDPTNGHVLIGDTGSQIVHELDSSGAFLFDVTGAATERGFLVPQGIVVDSAGKAYVANPVYPVYEVDVFGSPVVVPTTTTGEASAVTKSSATLSGTVDPDGIAVSDCHFSYVSEEDFQATGYASATDIPCAPNPGSGSGAVAVAASLSSLQPGTTYHFRLSATNANGTTQGEDKTFATIPAIKDLSTGSATDITANAATLNGSLDPDGIAVANCHFSYVSAADFQATGYASAADVPCASNPGSGSGLVNVSAHPSDLAPDTVYHFRLVASNATGTTKGGDETLRSFSAPFVLTLQAAAITKNTAVVGGTVDPKRLSTIYYVEYATTEDLSGAISVPASQDKDAGSGDGPVTVSFELTGLVPGTTYYYRLVATNREGPTNGETLSFTTSTTSPPQAGELPDGRVWEMVSPPDKNGAGVARGSFVQFHQAYHIALAAGSGDAVSYASSGGFGGDSTPAFAQYIARRGSTGWRSEGINPRYEPAAGIGAENNYEWLSDDLSWGITHTNAALNSGDPTGVESLYFRNNENRTYQAISNADPVNDEKTFFRFLGASSDASHILFNREPDRFQKYEPSHLFERTGGTVREVGILPDGTAVPARPGSGSLNGYASLVYSVGDNPISDDGNRIFFSPELESGNSPNLYVRENGEKTTLVTQSERTEPDPLPLSQARTEFQLAATDGRMAFFTSDRKLTDDSKAIGSYPDLYRWDSTAPEGQRLTDISVGESQGPGDVLATTGAIDDATTVYFAARGKLTNDAVRGAPNLYLWQEGKPVKLVATLVEGDSSVWMRLLIGGANANGDNVYRETRVTPDGRYIAFTSRAQLSSYDTKGTKQIYLYDSQSEDLSCVSCGTVEPFSGASSWFASNVTEEDEPCCNAIQHLSRNLTPNGSRLVFDSRDALVPTDTNGVTDVYEWSNGQLSLLSGGTNAEPSRLLDVSEDGDDVFFTTAEKLVRSDIDNLVDLYDARVGGIVEPNPPVPCVGDECQGTPGPPPAFPTPGSSSFSGAGSGKTASKRKSCVKGKKRAHGRCVKKAKQKQSKNRGGRR